MVKNGTDGLLYSPNDKEGLKQALRSILQRSFDVRSPPTEEMQVLKHLNLYESVLK